MASCRVAEIVLRGVFHIYILLKTADKIQQDCCKTGIKSSLTYVRVVTQSLGMTAVYAHASASTLQGVVNHFGK